MDARNIPYRIPFARRAYEAGQQQGGLETIRRAILALVRTRAGAVAQDIQARVEGCDDMAVLERWHEAVAQAADESAVRAALGD